MWSWATLEEGLGRGQTLEVGKGNEGCVGPEDEGLLPLPPTLWAQLCSGLVAQRLCGFLPQSNCCPIPYCLLIETRSLGSVYEQW